MAQLIKPQIKWTPEKIELVRKEYPLGDKQKLCEELGVTRKVLGYAARRFGVKSLTTKNKLNYKNLLDDTQEALYWQGFIMGDGNIINSGRLSVALSEKDLPHLNSLQKFIQGKSHIKNFKLVQGFSIGGSYCILTSSDKITADAFLKKFNLNGAKTYNPPDLTCISCDNQFLAFFIGLFDADGCFDIRKPLNVASSMKIELHYNWMDTLLYIKDRLKTGFNIDSSVKETARGYAKLLIYKYHNFKFFKNKIKEFSIPALDRKWDTIDVNYTAKKLIVSEKFDDITSMLVENKSWAEISSILGIGEYTCKLSYERLRIKKTEILTLTA
jgi:hypothetical protein